MFDKDQEKLVLSIETKSWMKETTDLYDFEAKNLAKKSFTIQSESLLSNNSSNSLYLIRNSDDIKLINSQQEIKNLLNLNQNTNKEELKLLSEINYNPRASSFTIKNTHSSNHINQYFKPSDCDRMYTILPRGEYVEIKENDIIKLGRARLKFSKFHFNSKEATINENIDNNDNKNDNDYAMLEKTTCQKNRSKISLTRNINQQMSSTIRNNNNNYINTEYIASSINQVNNTNTNTYNMNRLPTSILYYNYNNTNYNNNNNNDKSCITTANLSIINNNNNNNNNNHNKDTSLFSSPRVQEKKQCRICYGTTSDLDDPLVSPCNCTGSMKYIHYQCLKSCIMAKATIKEEDDIIYYSLKCHHCEICLHEYPKYLVYNYIVYNLIDVDFNKFDKFICVDYYAYEDTNANSSNHLALKGIFLVKIEEEKHISIGRTQSNKVKLKDISVSRKHGCLLMKNNCLFYQDLNSKFGSLKYIKVGFNVNIGDIINVLSGKHFIEFYLYKKNSFFNMFKCCSFKQNEVELNFYEENVKEKDDKDGGSGNDYEYNSCGYIGKYECKRISNYFDDSYNDFVVDISYINLDGNKLDNCGDDYIE